jgi:hypothetical protein
MSASGTICSRATPTRKTMPAVSKVFMAGFCQSSHLSASPSCE